MAFPPLLSEWTPRANPGTGHGEFHHLYKLRRSMFRFQRNRTLLVRSLSISIFASMWVSQATSPAAAQTALQGASNMAFTIQSSGFANGADIPRAFTCDGEDRSPDLSWSGAPEGTKVFALIADDPDAPAGTWVH